MDKIIIIGGKGTAVVLAEHIYDAQYKHGSQVEFIGFAFDDESYGDEINGFPVLSKTYDVYEKYKKYSDVKFIFQLYRFDKIEERIGLLESYKIPKDRYFTFIHPSCMISKSARIGTGTVIMANSVVNANAIIGNHCTVLSHVTVGHNAIIGDYNFFATHSIISNLKMGNGNFIGINASTNNFISIGDYCFVGMASNVTKSLSSGVKVYGNPAKPFEKKIDPNRHLRS